MTEQLFPDDMANGLVDGTMSPDEVPADLQATASLLRAAASDPTAVTVRSTGRVTARTTRTCRAS